MVIVYCSVMNDIQLAWIAGLLDGEGSFGLRRGYRNGNLHHRVWVTCGMSDTPQNREALTIIHNRFGGYMGFSKAKKHDNRRDTVSWTAASRKGYDVLKALLPYLVVKKPHALLLTEFQEKWVSRTGTKKNPKKFAKQVEYFDKLRILNVRGKLRLQRLSEVTPKGDAIV